MRAAFAETTGVKRRSLLQDQRKSAILVAIGGSLAAGLLADGSGSAHLAALLWMVGTGIALAALALEIVTKLRQREIGLDIVAALSMSAALAFGVPLAGNVVGLMYAGGQFLESLAAHRARREMTALLATRAPGRSAMSTAPCRALRSAKSRRATGCLCGRAMSSPWTVLSRPGWRFSTSRR